MYNLLPYSLVISLPLVVRAPPILISIGHLCFRLPVEFLTRFIDHGSSRECDAIILAYYVLIMIAFNPHTLLSLCPWARYKYFVLSTLYAIQPIPRF